MGGFVNLGGHVQEGVQTLASDGGSGYFLLELLLADMKGQAGALPFLEHALFKLWEQREGRRLTAKAYLDGLAQLDDPSNLAFDGKNLLLMSKDASVGLGDRVQTVSIGHTYIFSPTTIAEVKGGYMKVGIFSYPSNYKTNVSQTFGLPGVNIDDLASGLALQNISGYAILGDTQNIPLITKDLTQQYQASLTRTVGAHNFKVGAGVILRRFGATQSQQPNGLWTYDNQLTRSATGTGGNALAC